MILSSIFETRQSFYLHIMTVSFNYKDEEIVGSPSIIVIGRTSTQLKKGAIQFLNNQNKVFSPQCFEINGRGYYKAVLHVSEGANNFDALVYDNAYIDQFGFLNHECENPQIADKGSITIYYNRYPEKKPLHLCLIMGRDSQGLYDMPSYRLARGESSTVESAVRKLKVAGRLMQAFTHDEMRNAGLGNRSFEFVEEEVSRMNIYGYTVLSPTPHREIKIFVLKSPKSVAELRDPNLAQQNPNGNNKGGLFGHALEVINNDPYFSATKKQHGKPVQCAVLYLDTHFDSRMDLILTHAALGGGTNDVKLAIFGSHGLHSWPINFPQITPSFLDATHLSKREVANDCNECGTSWECLNVTLGAFMHEIGHLLGCPHQENGVMLRDYVWFNRSFMTRESECLRRKTRPVCIPSNGFWDKVCHWHILDLYRFLYHGSFSIMSDFLDSTFNKVANTLEVSQRNPKTQDADAALAYSLPSGGVVLKSDSGIYLIEYIVKDLARSFIVFLPKLYGGPGVQNEVYLDYKQGLEELKRNGKDPDQNYNIKVLSIGGEYSINNFKNACQGGENIVKSHFNFSDREITGYKSTLLGKSKDKKEQIIGFDIFSVRKIRIYHGGALDGMTFYQSKYESNAAPPIPPRSYIDKLKDATSNVKKAASEELALTIGNQKPRYSDFKLGTGEYITKFLIRNGAWIDGIQFETNTGRRSPFYGNANGGHLSTLEAPRKGYRVVGMYGYAGSWLDGLGIIYAPSS